jgi:hypothetical protein
MEPDLMWYLLYKSELPQCSSREYIHTDTIIRNIATEKNRGYEYLWLGR